MGGSIKLGKLFGIPININYTWFIIVAILTFQLATLSFPVLIPGQPALLYWVAGLATAVLLFVSVLLHELAHSVVSKARGTPVEGITLFLFGGVSSISDDAPRPQDELVMAAAGPLSSVVIGVVLLLLSRLGSRAGFLTNMALLLGQANLGLAIFNLIPGFPLDGGRVLRSLIWWATGKIRVATRWASGIGRAVAILMIVGGLALALVFGAWSTGLWLVVIGWFLENAAGQSYQQLVLRETLAGVSARDLMTPDCARVDENADLQTLVEEKVLNEGRRCMLVARGDQLAGLLTVHSIKEVPRSEWALTRASSAMIPFDRVKTVDADATALSVLRRLDEGDINQIPVMERNRLVGVITREHLLRFIRNKAELTA